MNWGSLAGILGASLIPVTGGLSSNLALMGAGGMLGGMFGGDGGGKKKEDPLAGIRGQLTALAGQVPGLVQAQQKLNKEAFDVARGEGRQGIQENVHAVRGLGASSIEDRLTNELLDKLARGQSQADLEAQKWGLSEQGRLLTGAARMGGDQGEDTSWWDNLAGIGESLSGIGDEEEIDLSKLLGGKLVSDQEEKSSIIPTTVQEDVATRPGTYMRLLSDKSLGGSRYA